MDLVSRQHCMLVGTGTESGVLRAGARGGGDWSRRSDFLTSGIGTECLEKRDLSQAGLDNKRSGGKERDSRGSGSETPRSTAVSILGPYRPLGFSLIPDPPLRTIVQQIQNYAPLFIISLWIVLSCDSLLDFSPRRKIIYSIYCHLRSS